MFKETFCYLFLVSSIFLIAGLVDLMAGAKAVILTISRRLTVMVEKEDIMMSMMGP